MQTEKAKSQIQCQEKMEGDPKSGKASRRWREKKRGVTQKRGAILVGAAQGSYEVQTSLLFLNELHLSVTAHITGFHHETSQ